MQAPPTDPEPVPSPHDDIERFLDQVETVIRGKRRTLRKIFAAMLARGHILLEDMPGVGKTTLAKTIVHLLEGCTYNRIQFTPDLLPYDITGVDVWHSERREFVFSPGPAFCNFLLADEINRAAPKVQSALLEVMAERQITIGNQTHRLNGPFWVIATQNPIETLGTYPLPKAQTDRFSLRLSLGYPDFSNEVQIVSNGPAQYRLSELKPCLNKARIQDLQRQAEKVHCSEQLIEWTVALARRTREHPLIRFGVSTRGVLTLIACSRAYAMIQGRDYVTDQDLIDLIPSALEHRLELKPNAPEPGEVLREILEESKKKLP